MKKSRAARPLAKWKIDAPTIIVLSTSKKAAACGSGGTCCGRVSSSPCRLRPHPARVSTGPISSSRARSGSGRPTSRARQLTETGQGQRRRPRRIELPPIRPGMVGVGRRASDAPDGAGGTLVGADGEACGCPAARATAARGPGRRRPGGARRRGAARDVPTGWRGTGARVPARGLLSGGAGGRRGGRAGAQGRADVSRVGSLQARAVEAAAWQWPRRCAALITCRRAAARRAQAAGRDALDDAVHRAQLRRRPADDGVER